MNKYSILCKTTEEINFNVKFSQNTYNLMSTGEERGLKAFLIVLLCLILLAILLYIMPIKMRVKILRRDENDFLAVRLKTLYGVIDHTFEAPLLDIVFINQKPALKYQLDLETNRKNKLLKRINKVFSDEDLQNVRRFFKGDRVLLLRLLHYWREKLLIQDFSFVFKYGLQDAALAAILYGLIWAVLGALLSLASNNLNFSAKDISVIPHFDSESYSIEFNCIIKFKFGDIINIGMIVLRRILQRRKIEAQLDAT